MNTSRALATAATAFGGLLAGATADRWIVQIPALHELGLATWSDYSRHADLSLRGFAFYPAVGIGHAILTVATAIVADGKMRTPARVAAILALGGMATTLKAAPFMLSVLHLGNNPRELEMARRGFEFWSAIRAACQVGAFAANVLTLAK